MIPTYNQAAFIGDAIKSALQQDYPFLEVVICDDASTDETDTVVASFKDDGRIRYYRNSSNLGRLANYRRLLYELAKGAWVINLDGDDFFLDSRYISQTVKLATSDPQIVLVFGKAAKGRAGDPNPTILNAQFGATRVLDGTRFCLEHGPYGTVAPLHMTCIYRRDAAMAEDFYALTEFASFYGLMLGCKVGFIDSVAGVWRQHGGNASDFLTFDRLRDNYGMLERICQAALDKGCFTCAEGERWLRQRAARFFLSMLKQTVLGRYAPSTAIRMTVRLLSRKPTFVADLPASIAQTCARLLHL
jgi:glycosyltransferase involved in cell wall biosynthesis